MTEQLILIPSAPSLLCSLGRIPAAPPTRSAAVRSTKKTAPVFHGGQVALVLSRCESLVGGLTAGWPLAQKQSLGGGIGRYITAALCRLRRERFGVTLLPGPPNCFPSTANARC